jgi:hypothetical protein
MEKLEEIRYIKHEFRNHIFERGMENNPKSPNLLNYTLTSGKQTWKEGMIVRCFINLGYGIYMYHSSIKVGQAIKKNGVWVGNKEEIENFLSKIPLTPQNEPIDNGPYLWNGDFIKTDDWQHGEIVDWVKTSKGGIPRNTVSKKPPTKKLSSNRFDYIEKITDLNQIPYPEIFEWLKSEKMIKMLQSKVSYRWTGSENDYIGSASGVGGLLQRLNDYLSNGHGNNKKMIEESIKNPSFLQSCHFSVLAVYPEDYTKEDILRHEANLKKHFPCSWN